MFWIEASLAHFEQRLRNDTLTHAVMLAGRRGLAKRALALQLAARFLDVPLRDADDAAAAQIVDRITAPDFHAVGLADDKRQISVEQIRDLKEAFALSAHAAAGKVALVEPADAMTIAAANALLKTLEEPPAQSLLILVADDMSRIPATIASRCTIYRVRPPATDDALAWLSHAGIDAADAAMALQCADGAPLAALQLASGAGLQSMQQVWADLELLASGRARPMAAAARWQQLRFEDVIDALRFAVQQAIRGRATPIVGAVSDFADYVMDSRDAFCYLDTLNGVAAKTAGSFNAELALETLALPWSERLRGLYRRQTGHA